MKKFKPNMFTMYMFAVIEYFSPFCVGIPIIILLSGNENYSTNDILSIFPLCINAVFWIIVFSCALNLITLPFTKYTVFLFDDYFSYENTEVRYNDVTRIEIDSGLFTRHRRTKPCSLDCYSSDKLLISIKNPSLLMVFLVFRRCKNSQFRYKRIKKFLFTWAIALFLCIIIGLK